MQTRLRGSCYYCFCWMCWNMSWCTCSSFRFVARSDHDWLNGVCAHCRSVWSELTWCPFNFSLKLWLSLKPVALQVFLSCFQDGDVCLSVLPSSLLTAGWSVSPPSSLCFSVQSSDCLFPGSETIQRSQTQRRVIVMKQQLSHVSLTCQSEVCGRKSVTLLTSSLFNNYNNIIKNNGYPW